MLKLFLVLLMTAGLSACGGGGGGGGTPPVGGVPVDSAAPTTPTNLTGTALSASAINLTWTASTDDIGVTHYEIRRDGTNVANSPTNSYSDTGRTAGTTYAYSVVAVDASGKRSTPAQVSVTTPSVTPPPPPPPGGDTTAPSVPTGVSANVVSSTEIRVTWTASTDNVGVAGYRVFTNGANPGTSSDTSHPVTGLTPGTTYTFTVVAYDAAANTSAASAAVSATTSAAADTTAPSTPTGLTATAVGTTQINLAWSASTDNVAVTGYRIFRGGTQIATVTSGTTYSNTGLSAGTAYSYTVQAFDAANNSSGQSASASATTGTAADTQAPTTPSGLTATAVSASQINLSWTASTDNVGVTAYRVYRGGTQIATVTSGTTYSNTGLSASTAYSYTVQAIDAAGNASAQSAAASATTSASTDTQAPTAPSGLTATAVSASQVNLSWTASTDNVGVTGYRIFRGGTQITTVTSGTSYSNAGLSANTSYTYTVQATDAAGNVSAQSASATATTQSTVTSCQSAACAFPGAEGFGTGTQGGRGGPVILVTNLNSSGPGSFRQAMLTPGPRIIVFRVSGVIDLGFSGIDLKNEHSNVTVLGQSSPGGITILNGTIGSYQANFHDAIFRFLRVRGPGNYDNISLNGASNFVIDHMDFSGGSDEAFDVTFGHDFTVQWSTVNNSRSGTGSQNYGWLIAYKPNTNISLHHNLSAHHNGRCGAQFHWDGSAPEPVGGAAIDIRNNVFYNCGFSQIYRADRSPSTGVRYNLVGNYAKSGPNTPTGAMMFSMGGNNVYGLDNVYPGQSVYSPFSGPPLASTPFNYPAVTTTTSAQAFEQVLSFAGSWPRDAMNIRTVQEVRNGTGALGKNDDPLTTSGPAPAPDADLDGIPDSWESSHGLNPNNNADSRALHSSGYANIEVYLNEVAAQIIGQ